jgi:hypothetical protein
VWLTDFGIASQLPRERQTPTQPEIIAGTLDDTETIRDKIIWKDFFGEIRL